MPTSARTRAILRRLAAAVLLRAVDDARAGDLSAAQWLLEDGLDLAQALGISEDRVRAWDRCRRRQTKRAGAQ